MQQPIKVAIADDHKIFRKGIILSLANQSNIQFVLEAENGQQLIDAVQKQQPDVILMDLKMPVKDGIETTKFINKHYPGIAILIVTMYDDERYVSYLMENGANGYILKNTEPDELLKAITDVVSKGYYLNTFVNKILLKKSQLKTKLTISLDSSIKVSAKEKEVLSYICLELTSQEIADKLNTSSRTIEGIKEKLMERFGVKNIAGLVFFAVKNELVS